MWYKTDNVQAIISCVVVVCYSSALDVKEKLDKLDDSSVTDLVARELREMAAAEDWCVRPHVSHFSSCDCRFILVSYEF